MGGCDGHSGHSEAPNSGEASGVEEPEQEGREGVGWEWWEARPLRLPHQALRFKVFLKSLRGSQTPERLFIFILILLLIYLI